MAELGYEKKRVVRIRNIFPAGASIEEVLDAVRNYRVPGELRIGFPGNGGVNFIEFTEKEKTETVYYEPK